MVTDRLTSACGVALLGFAALLLAGEVAADPRRIRSTVGDTKAWTTATSVARRSFDADTPTVSPNGGRIFFVATHGNEACDCNVSELSVFRVNKINRALKKGKKYLAPDASLTLEAGKGNSSAINYPHWTPDGQKIIFTGSAPDGTAHIYSFEPKTHAVARLTKWPAAGPYRAFGEGPLFIGYGTEKPAKVPPPVYPVHLVTRHDLLVSVTGDDARRKSVIFVSSGFKRTKRTFGFAASLADYAPIFSPNNRAAVVIGRQTQSRPQWRAYDANPPAIQSYEGSKQPLSFLLAVSKKAGEPAVSFFPSGEYTRSGAALARQGLKPQVIWSRDSRHALFINVALPLDAEHSERRLTPYISQLDLETGRWSLSEPLIPFKDHKQRITVHLDHDGTILRVNYGTSITKNIRIADSPQAGFVADSRASGKPENLLGALDIRVKESANSPPEMVASRSDRSLKLTKPDPALVGVFRTPSEPFTWTSDSGKQVTGGLLLPHNSIRPAPLVVQAYSYSADRFQPDGPEDHVYAAQVLAADGFVVLNLPIPLEDEPPLDSKFELKEFSQRLQGAIRALAKRGIVDSKRVGLIGFSRAGFNTYYAISHPAEFNIAAAVIDDAFSGTYTYHLWSGALGVSTTDTSQVYGDNGSFWRGKQQWLDDEFTFNADRVRTPLLISTHGDNRISLLIDKIGALKLNQVPFEILAYPSARNGAYSHRLISPRQRLASYQASIDWLEFWLAGRRPTDEDRALRWDTMRSDSSRILQVQLSP